MTALPTLVACSHGTDSPEGRAVIASLARRAAELCDVPLAETYVDVQQPQVDEVVKGLVGPGVIVPLLLSPGFHTAVDIGSAARSRADVVAAGTLGPHPALVDVLADHVTALGAGPHDRVVLAAAGSSRPESAARVREVRDQLASRLPAPVTTGFAYGASPSVGEAVAEARLQGSGRVIVASYVLAPGHFANLIARAGADAVTDPVGTDARVAQIVAERYREGLEQLG